jgi:hypothetical protein
VAHIWRWKYSLGFSLLINLAETRWRSKAVHALQIIGQPADVVLGRDDLQLREAIEDAREDQHAERLLDLVRQHGRTHVALAPIVSLLLWRAAYIYLVARMALR